MKKNNDRTETELIEDPKHLACVKKMAWHYYGFVPADKRGLITIEDLISAGNEGLVIAAGKYRAGSGAKFTTYLTKWIKGEMIRELTFYLGKDALLIDDAEKLAASEDPAAAGSAGADYDLSDIPREKQVRIITAKLKEYRLTQKEINVYLAVNGIGRDKVTNLRTLGRQLNKRETEIRRIRQRAEYKLRKALA